MEENRTNKAYAVRGFIYALTLLEAPVFFAVYAVMGRTYEGSETSNSYVMYMVGLLLIQAYFLIQKRRIPKKQFALLVLPILFAGLVWVTAAIYHTSINIGVIRNCLLWQYTGIILAINIHSFNNKESIINSLIILMFLITAGAVRNILLPFLNGRLFYYRAGYSMSGNSLQSQSYYIAVAAGLNLFFFAMLKRAKWTIIFSFVLLGVQLICAILAGGRGAMVLALVYCIVYYFYSNRNEPNMRLKLQRFAIYLVVFIVLSVVLWKIIETSSLLQQRLGRVFSYIGEGGIDMSQTSNRDVRYSEALEYIMQSPILGYGITGYLYLSGMNRYPHNILLEFLLDGGLIYTIIWIVVIITGHNRIRRFSETNTYCIYLVMALYALMHLMFSGSYSFEMLFWFSVVFSYICNREVPVE